MKNKTLLVSEMLKDWYFIDSVLLNGHAKNVITEDTDYNEYISLKAALLSDLYEFYRYVGFTSSDKKLPATVKALQENAVLCAKKSKKVAASMIERKDFRDHIKNTVIKEVKKNSNPDIIKLSDTIINERFLKMAMDNVLVGAPIIECVNKDKINDFKSGILEQAYLTIRNDMIQIAKKYNKSFQKNESYNKK